MSNQCGYFELHGDQVKTKANDVLVIESEKKIEVECMYLSVIKAF